MERAQRRTVSALTSMRFATLQTVNDCLSFRIPGSELPRLTSLLTEAALAKVIQVGQVRRAGGLRRCK